MKPIDENPGDIPVDNPAVNQDGSADDNPAANAIWQQKWKL
jgi:hypothetical protein